jgi:hypothetical protein
MAIRSSIDAAQDAAILQECQEYGEDLARPLAVTHFFSLAEMPGPEPREAVKKLKARCLRVVWDEERSADDLWHVAAFVSEVLTPASTAQMRAEMDAFASANGLTYDGWARTRTGQDERRLITWRKSRSK